LHPICYPIICGGKGKAILNILKGLPPYFSGSYPNS
jgi:hypothetical protein